MAQEFQGRLCGASYLSQNEIKIKKQSVALNENASINIIQNYSQFTVNHAVIASNVICQEILGQHYTGSKEEWQQFLNSTVSGLLKANVKDIKITLQGTEERVFNSELASREYVIEGDNYGNKQVFYNLAILNQTKSVLYTVSVSGNKRAMSEVKAEFYRLVKSFKLLK